MVEITYPGVYVEELPFGVASIPGVATSTTGFVGEAERGPACTAVNVKSFSEFERAFGGRKRAFELGDAVWQFFANGGAEAWVVRAPKGMPRSEALPDLDAADSLSLLCLPGETDLDVLRGALEYVERRWAFLLIDPPGPDLDRTIDLARSLARAETANGAVYFPPVQLELRTGGGPRVCPPSGAVAGMYARHDRSVGVWGVPEGREAVLAGVAAAAIDLSDDEISRLTAAGVNCIRKLPAGGVAVSGAQTLQGGEQSTSEWKYVHVRRLTLFIEESLYRGTQWVVFEPNDEPSWAKILLQAGLFLEKLFRAGALEGPTPDQAYVLRCGRDTMTQDDIDNGRLTVVIGVAPVKPAEFVNFAIGQWLPRTTTESFDASGFPCERRRLQHQPVTGEGVFLQVGDRDGWTTWTEVDRFDDATSGAHVYRLDRETNELIFGDGEHGLVLPAGGDNVRATYRYGSGRRCHPPTASPPH
jgi:hypothetical protein